MNFAKLEDLRAAASVHEAFQTKNVLKLLKHLAANKAVFT